MLKPKLKVIFDVNNPTHVKSFKKYYVDNAWGGPCPYELEDPYKDVPSMIVDKIIKKSLGIK